jgi:hypothetical protein
VRKIRPYSGLVRYEAHNDALEWPQALKETLATEKPKVIVVMLGLNDRQTLRERIGQAPQKSITGQNETATAPSSAEPGHKARGLGTLPPRLRQQPRPPQLRYDLAKLRAKGLVAKLPNSRRYRLLPQGYSICLIFPEAVRTRLCAIDRRLPNGRAARSSHDRS